MREELNPERSVSEISQFLAALSGYIARVVGVCDTEKEETEKCQGSIPALDAELRKSSVCETNYFTCQPCALSFKTNANAVSAHLVIIQDTGSTHPTRNSLLTYIQESIYNIYGFTQRQRHPPRDRRPRHSKLKKFDFYCVRKDDFRVMI